MKEFTLNGEAFIELDKLLKLLRLVNSGGEAHLAITEGEVRVNGIPETRKRKKLVPGDLVQFQTDEIRIIA
ncbi:MAG: RNA-binding S4 domain-containing protein [Bacteroidales bacterium]